jgi:hypothetical protein
MEQISGFSSNKSILKLDFKWGPARGLASPDRFGIEPGLPLVGGPQFHRQTREGSVFHNAIADTEPDEWGRRVIQRDHAKRRGSTGYDMRARFGPPRLSIPSSSRQTGETLPAETLRRFHPAPRIRLVDAQPLTS